jgi:hypothetical protein
VPDPLEIATTWWSTLADRCLRDDRIRPARGFGRRVHLWPATQVVHAGILVEGLLDGDRRRDQARAVDAGVAALGWYRSGDAWGPRRGERPRYADDVAWLGLALATLADVRGTQLLDDVHRALAFVRSCEDPEGGVRWHEDATSRHTCSTAPGAHLALRVDPARHGDFAQRALTWLDERLLRPDGLYGDHVGTSVDDTVWAYNQGEPAAARALLGGTAQVGAAVDRLADPEVLWAQPQVFVGIGMRDLIPLDPSGRLLGAALVHLERVRAEGLGDDGFPRDDGPGRYGDDVAIDLAGLIQVAASCVAARSG